MVTPVWIQMWQRRTYVWSSFLFRLTGLIGAFGMALAVLGTVVIGSVGILNHTPFNEINFMPVWRIIASTVIVGALTITQAFWIRMAHWMLKS